jgi:hypothetical protein
MSVLAIADTGFLYAYLDPDDQHHVWACEQFSHFPCADGSSGCLSCANDRTAPSPPSTCHVERSGVQSRHLPLPSTCGGVCFTDKVATQGLASLRERRGHPSTEFGRTRLRYGMITGVRKQAGRLTASIRSRRKGRIAYEPHVAVSMVMLPS